MPLRGVSVTSKYPGPAQPVPLFQQTTPGGIAERCYMPLTEFTEEEIQAGEQLTGLKGFGAFLAEKGLVRIVRPGPGAGSDKPGAS